MKFTILLKTLTILLLCGGVKKSQQVTAGWAFGMNNVAIEQSKQELVSHLQRSMRDIALPEYVVPFLGDNHFHDNWFKPRPFNTNDVWMGIVGDCFELIIKPFDCQIEGYSWKKNIFGVDERFGFQMFSENGGFQLKIQFKPSWEYMNGKKVPVPKVTMAEFSIPEQSKITFNMQTKDVGPLIMDASIQVFKPLFISVILPIISGASLVSTLNGFIRSEMNSTKGKMPLGMLEGLLYLIPGNNIQIPETIFMSYAMAQDFPVVISQNLIYGYYEGEITGLPASQAITNPQYSTPGFLSIAAVSQPFQLQISASLINNMFEVILGTNQVSVDIPYWIFAENDFPLDFTSTTMEAAVPGLTDVIGFDIPLSARFWNRGAPRFIFSKDEMYITYNLEADIFDEDYTKKLFKVYYDNVEVKFDMKLENNVHLNVEWEQVSMEAARIKDDQGLFSLKDQEKADQHMLDFFDWSLDFILPWIQVTKPQGLCKFLLPNHIPELVYIDALTMSVQEKFLSFGMNPRFIIPS